MYGYMNNPCPDDPLLSRRSIACGPCPSNGQSACGAAISPGGTSSNRRTGRRAATCARAEASARAAVAARDLEREIAHIGAEDRRLRRVDHAGMDILLDLDDMFTGLILDHDENGGTQHVNGANDRREAPVQINLRPAEGR